MTKKILHKTKRKPRTNWFDLGGGLLNGVASGVSKIINPSGNSTGVGNALQTIGSAASNIPGIGGVIGAGVNMIGGIYNAAFGSNINEEFVEQTEDKAEQQANYVSGASDNASLLADWSSFNNMAHVDQDDVGTDGWFSNKAKNETNRLNETIDDANLRAFYSLKNSADNINKQNSLLALSNYAAYGGPLTMRYTGTMSPFGNQFGEGGSIHIKPENRGKFTALKKRTGKSASWFKEHGTPAQRKMATFALNAKKWKHSFGGELNTQGGDFTNGILHINSGGTHEQNPYEGVQLGVDNQGIPNLVEEGEVVWNDYVFSNRLKPSKNMKKKYKYKGDTFADIAKNIQKESEERPNDPISKKGLNVSMSRLSSLQEGMRQRNHNRINNKFSEGGRRHYSNYTKLTDDSFYTPEYMTFWNYIKDNRNSEAAKEWLDRINNEEFGYVGGNTFTIDDIIELSHDYKRGPVHNAFAQASRAYNKLSRNPYTSDYLSTNLGEAGITMLPKVSSEELFGDLVFDLSEEDKKSILSPSDNVDDSYSLMPDKNNNIPSDINSDEDKVNPFMKSSLLRYAPIIGHGIAAFSDLFSDPDYSAAERVESVDINPALVSYTPVGNYLSYNPFDKDYYINKLNASSGASRRALGNTSGGNRAAMMAGLLASDYNYGTQLGTLARQAEEYNQQQRERVEGFNRQTNLANSEMGLKASMANAESRNKATQLRLNKAGTVAAMRQAARDSYNARRSNNINVLLDELGSLGTEQTYKNWLDWMAEKGVLKANTSGEVKAKGGRIKTRKKKGYTYG